MKKVSTPPLVMLFLIGISLSFVSTPANAEQSAIERALEDDQQMRQQLQEDEYRREQQYQQEEQLRIQREQLRLEQERNGSEQQYLFY